MRTSIACLVLVGSVGCSSDDKCDPMKTACTLETTVSTITVPAGVEDEDTCQSWTLNNPTELWVNAIAQSNDGAYHHANWFFVPDDQFPLPDGTWSCSQQQFSELVAALLGGYLFALSTQSHGEDQQLPPNSAIRIPPYSRVIGSSHLLNTGDTDVVTAMHLALRTIPPADVVQKLAPARITYHDLHLDPTKKSSFTTECLLDDAYRMTAPGAFNYKLVYTLAHYHGLGRYAQLEIAGGPRDGEVIMRRDGTGENFGFGLEPALDLVAAGARGLRFTCGYDNPRAAEVGWGIGDQEMCVLALQAVTDVAFDAEVTDGTDGMIDTGPDGEVHHGGPCKLNMFPWDFEKPGGPAR